MKVAIMYGALEGHWHGKRLKEALRAHGHTLIESPIEADIIIAHSGGCFLVPSETKARLIMLVGIPYWPGKHLFRQVKDKVQIELKNLWWYKKTFFNTFYLLTKPAMWLRMRRTWKKQGPPSHETATVLLVRSEHDFFLHLVEGRNLALTKGWEFITLPGQHDGLWSDPEPYLQIMHDALKAN